MCSRLVSGMNIGRMERKGTIPASRLPHDPVPGPGENVCHMGFPCILIGNIPSCDLIIPEFAKAIIHRGEDARSILYPSDMITFRVKDKETKTSVEPAETGAGLVNSTECPTLQVEPEKRAGHRSQQTDILLVEEFLFVRIERDYYLFSRDRKPDPEPVGPYLRLDADDIPHVTATFPALLTPEYHRWSPLVGV